MVEAMRRAPLATTALIDLFTASHDPSASSGREAAMKAATEAFENALNDVRAIDDDRILRLLRAVVVGAQGRGEGRNGDNHGCHPGDQADPA